MADASIITPGLPYNALLSMFYMMVHGFCTSIVVKVTRRRGRRERVDYPTPNVNYVWEHYVSRQPKFRHVEVESERCSQVREGTNGKRNVSHRGALFIRRCF